MAFLRLLAMLLVALTVVYLSLYFYLRAARREKLEQDYNPEATDLERSVFVDAQLDAYAKLMGRVLAFVVYVVPLVGFAVIILTSNLG